MQKRLPRLIRNLSLILASVLLLVGEAWGAPRTNNGVAFHRVSGITAVHSRSAGVRTLAYDNEDKSLLTPRDNQVPSISPGSTDRLVAGLEWIAAMPEPRAIVFLGTALLVASGIARRRFMRNGKVRKD